jgi:chemotaxis protein methyltransferase CheR
MSGARDLAFVRELVHARSGVLLEAEKDYFVEARLTVIARRERLSGLDDLVRRLRRGSDPALARRVVEALMIHETSFFRDVHPFDILREQVVPELLARRKAERALYMWSAACASGQEAYSAAMTLASGFPELASWDVRVFASDLSEAMVARTRAASYSQQEVNRGLPVQMLVRFLEQRGRDWLVVPELRAWVRARQLNLIGDWSGQPRMDVIFLRNVLIYLDPARRAEVLERAHRCLRGDGYLFLGGAETLVHSSAPFERVECRRGSCYRPR